MVFMLYEYTVMLGRKSAAGKGYVGCANELVQDVLLAKHEQCSSMVAAFEN